MQDETKPDQLEFDLAEIFGENVDIEPISNHSLGGTAVVVCNMSYIRHSSSPDSPDLKIRQTAVVLDADDLELPEFALSPSKRGLLGLIFSKLGGFGDINFADSPVFSNAYHLHGWAEKPVRVLFTPALREYFAEQTGWSVRGKDNRLVIFHHNHVCDPNRIDEFVADCLQILELFQQAEQEMDLQPDLRRETNAEDIAATAGRMGGLVGGMLQRQIAKMAVTRSELTKFLRDSPPRVLPAAIKRQGMGNTLPLVFIGLVFMIIGVVCAVITILKVEGMSPWIGVPFSIVFLLIGGLMSGLTMLHRRKKAVVLRNGTLTSGNVTKVEQTDNSINEQREHRVTITYSKRGKETTATVSAYGLGAQQARRLAKSGETVDVLVDPSNDQNVICPNLFVVLN